MNHQQISEFVNSKDVRDYLQSIHYEFNTAEAAWLVYHCHRLTMADRHKAWQEIINDMPDCTMGKRTNLIPIDSFHAFLTDYIELEKRSTQEFMNGAGCVYSYEHHELYTGNPCYCDGWCEDDSFFSNYNACIRHCKQRLNNNGDIDRIRIHKYRLDPPECPHPAARAETLLMNRDFEALSVDANYETDTDLAFAFDGMCFDFPTPFRRGDILVDCKTEGTSNCTPFVLSYITTWNSEKMLAGGFSKSDCPDRIGWEHFDKITEQILRKGDCTDGHAIGTMINAGNLFRDSFLTIPTDLTYFRGSLEEAERQLQVFSCYEKGEIDGEMLANTCFAIRVKACSEEIYQRCIAPYTKKSMERIGMLPVDKGITGE